jgi:hypothetical protein
VLGWCAIGFVIASEWTDGYGLLMQTLSLHWEASGPRYHLDGKPVHAGDVLEAQTSDGTWIPVRFEYDWDPAAKTIDPFLIVSGPEGTTRCFSNVPETPCRWPQNSL